MLETIEERNTIERNSDVQDDEVTAAPTADSPANDADEFDPDDEFAMRKREREQAERERAARDEWEESEVGHVLKELTDLQRGVGRTAGKSSAFRAGYRDVFPEPDPVQAWNEQDGAAGELSERLALAVATIERWEEGAARDCPVIVTEQELAGMAHVLRDVAEGLESLGEFLDEQGGKLLGWGGIVGMSRPLGEPHQELAALAVLTRHSLLAMRRLARAAGISPDVRQSHGPCRAGSMIAQSAVLMLAARPDAPAIVKAFQSARENDSELTGEWMRPFVPAGTDVLAACCGTLAPQAPAEPT